MFDGDAVSTFQVQKLQHMANGASMRQPAWSLAHDPPRIPCIIPARGKKKGKPNDFQLFVEVLVDELYHLYHVGE